MKTISITNWKGNKYEGEWNEKFYSSKIEGHNELFRIYINNESYHITSEERERIENSLNKTKVEKDNASIALIKNEFEKLDKEAKEKLLNYLQNMM